MTDQNGDYALQYGRPVDDTMLLSTAYPIPQTSECPLTDSWSTLLIRACAYGRTEEIDQLFLCPTSLPVRLNSSMDPSTWAVFMHFFRSGQVSKFYSTNFHLFLDFILWVYIDGII